MADPATPLDLLAACKAFLAVYEEVSEERHFGQMLDSAFADVLEPMYAAIAEIEGKESDSAVV